MAIVFQICPKNEKLTVAHIPLIRIVCPFQLLQLSAIGRTIQFMNEILASIITGIATLVAALIATQDGRQIIKAIFGARPADKISGSRGKSVLTRFIFVFVVGALAGALFFRVAAKATETIAFQAGYRVPVGTIMAYSGRTEPEGWLFCDGQEIGKNFHELRALVGDRTPDLRGQFLRGYDPTGKVDPEGSKRALGTFQNDEFMHHHHTAYLANGSDGGGRSGQGDLLYSVNREASTLDAGGAETRPKNFSVNFIIKD